jgi:hypothetical protein
MSHEFTKENCQQDIDGGCRIENYHRLEHHAQDI